MSVPVDLAALASTVERYGAVAFVVTVSDDGRPHTVSTRVRLDGAHLVADVGRTSAGNAIARPEITVLWPATAADPGDSLIVDGTAEVHADASQVPGATLRVRPTRAVQHRQGDADPSAPSCVPVGA
jgi:hypothetical protein